MKLIFSRKGFDSQYGGFPSPIMPDGSLCSLPIPSNDRCKFKDISFQDQDLGKIVSDLTKGCIKANENAHLDPDLRKDALQRSRGWLPAFGQVDQAQKHLEKKSVGLGDLFLFFGWFRKTVISEGRLIYKKGARDLHVIFGWLQVGQIYKPNFDKHRIPRWARYHPHVKDANLRGDNNTLYIASKQLNITGLPQETPGGGTFQRYKPFLCLTEEGEKRSIWRLPKWFYPNKIKPQLSYHSNAARWRLQSDKVILNTVARGQEFILDCDFYPKVNDWLCKIFARIS